MNKPTPDVEPTFEDFHKSSEDDFWKASDLMLMLGYQDRKTFKQVIDKASKVLNALEVDITENIIPSVIDNKQDFKLSELACYLIAMNGDPQKPEVIYAQAYFIHQKELSEGMKALSSIYKKAGIIQKDDFLSLIIQE